MMWTLVLALVFTLILLCVASFFLWQATQRLIEFDDLFALFIHDIETNVKYFNKLSVTPVLSNAPEVQEAHKNMMIMRDRLVEYQQRMAELTNTEVEKEGTN